MVKRFLVNIFVVFVMAALIVGASFAVISLEVWLNTFSDYIFYGANIAIFLVAIALYITISETK